MDEQVIDKATLVNRALIKLGQAATFSIDDENHISGKVDAVWPDLVAHCFGLHDWTFCRATYRLTRIELEPENGWCYRFGLPGNRIGEPLKILSDPRRDAPLREFSIEGGELFADVLDVWARCKVEVNPAIWDPAFRAAFTTALAGALAVPIQSDQDLEATYWQQAFGTSSQGGTGGLFGRLISQNVASDPPDSANRWRDPLTDARYS
ncbi:hypothetical protein GTW51_10040 [Aurantimonas aggregata]|uniref:Uncharacterized protein n=1 Tax=Aurantimonas aggregata TaxID=2047720 RepID=A0A6L9MH75_9HYPH|nr:hypothetical protein [Aurantimonas aggregata]NDV87041.1 hypothetical protein [Aurantimonas aggregata]